MPDFLLDDLNPPQRQAVTAGDGQVLVLAGPGSGKTRVLTRRLAYLIDRKDIPAYDIIAVTFTNKAAREMESRVVNMVNQSLEGIWLGTFHAMCARLLRRESTQAQLPFSANFVIFDANDQETLIKRALRELNIDDKTHRPAGVHAAISAAKNDLQLPKDIPRGSYRDEVVARVYEKYQEMLQLNNAVDFDDLPSMFWWMNSRTLTWLSTSCSNSSLLTITTSSWWGMRTSRFTAGAARIIAMCCVSRRTFPNVRPSCWSRITAPPRMCWMPPAR